MHPGLDPLERSMSLVWSRRGWGGGRAQETRALLLPSSPPGSAGELRDLENERRRRKPPVWKERECQPSRWDPKSEKS